MNRNTTADHVKTLAQRLAAMCSNEQPVIDVFLTAEMIRRVKRMRGENWFQAMTEHLYNEGFSVVFKTEPE